MTHEALQIDMFTGELVEPPPTTEDTDEYTPWPGSQEWREAFADLDAVATVSPVVDPFETPISELDQLTLECEMLQIRLKHALAFANDKGWLAFKWQVGFWLMFALAVVGIVLAGAG